MYYKCALSLLNKPENK